MVLPPRWGNNTVCVWSSLQQFLFIVFFPSHWVIQLWGFPFFLFFFFHTLLFWVLRLYFNFLEIIWLDTKKKKKMTSGRDFCFPYSSSLLAQNILIVCRTFVSQIPTTPPLTLSEPRMSPSRKFFCIIDALLFLLSTALSESSTSKTSLYSICRVCVCEGDGIAGLCRKNCGKLHFLISVTC